MLNPPDNSANRFRLAGGIVSGGLSSRMGTPKDLVELPDGSSMFAHILQELLSLVPVAVVAGPPRNRVSDPEVLYVDDSYKGAGPLAGIEAILNSGIAEEYLICSCDQPGVTVELLGRLIGRARENACFFRTADGIIQPFPGMFPITWLPLVRDALTAQRLALKHLIIRGTPDTVELDEESSRRLKSINSRYDLELLASSWAQSQ